MSSTFAPEGVKILSIGELTRQVKGLIEDGALGSALPGVVLEVYVPVEKVGQRVGAGDPLFLVDNRQLGAQLAYAAANLAAAQAQLAKLEATAPGRSNAPANNR